MDEPSASPENEESVPPPPLAFAPAPTTSPWVWVAVSLSAVAILSTMALPIIALMGLIALDGLDELGGDSYYVDQGSVLNAIEEPCEEMLDQGSKVSLGRSTAAAAASLTRWSKAAQKVVTAIDGAKPDEASRAWRDDWKETIVAVNAYAKHLGEPNNTLTLTSAAADLYWNTDAECGLPISIAALDPHYAGSILGE